MISHYCWLYPHVFHINPVCLVISHCFSYEFPWNPNEPARWCARRRRGSRGSMAHFRPLSQRTKRAHFSYFFVENLEKPLDWILFINHIDITDITPNLILVAGLIHQLSQWLGHSADRPWLQETELLHGVGHVRLNADGTCWTLMTAADQLSLGGVKQWRKPGSRDEPHKNHGKTHGFGVFHRKNATLISKGIMEVCGFLLISPSNQSNDWQIRVNTIHMDGWYQLMYTNVMELMIGVDHHA